MLLVLPFHIPDIKFAAKDPDVAPPPTTLNPIHPTHPRQAIHLTSRHPHPHLHHLHQRPRRDTSPPTPTHSTPRIMSTIRATATRLTTLTAPTARRTFSQIPARRSGHGSSYDAPGGWLFGVKPGEKYEKEGWEGPIYWGLCGSMVAGVVAYAFKPDTRYV